MPYQHIFSLVSNAEKGLVTLECGHNDLPRFAGPNKGGIVSWNTSQSLSSDGPNLGFDMKTVDEIARRLGEIHGELSALPEGQSSQRYELLKERDELRNAAAEYASSADEGRSTQELEAELASLRRSRKQIVASKTGYATSKGGNNAGPASGAWVGLSQKSLAAGGLARLNMRIGRLEDEIAAKHEEQPI